MALRWEQLSDVCKTEFENDVSKRKEVLVSKLVDFGLEVLWSDIRLYETGTPFVDVDDETKFHLGNRNGHYDLDGLKRSPVALVRRCKVCGAITSTIFPKTSLDIGEVLIRFDCGCLKVLTDHVLPETVEKIA